MNSRRFLISLKVFAFLFFSSSNQIALKAGNTLAFNSEKIKELYYSLPNNYQANIKELQNTESQIFIIQADDLCSDRSIRIRFNRYNELAHLGLFIINYEKDSPNYQMVFEYLERTFLQSCLLKDNSAILNMLQKEKIRVYYNGEELKDPSQKPIKSVFNFEFNKPFQLKKDSKFFTATWSLSEIEHLEIIFPNNFFVITGKDKYEHEIELSRDLRNIIVGEFRQINPSPDQLVKYKNNILVLKGEQYEQIPEISSNTYYYSNNPNSVVFDNNNFEESIKNLLLNIVPTNISFNLKFRLYDNKTETYSINLNTFFSYFNEKHNFYFGWQDSESLIKSASVFIYNPYFEYSHLMTIEFSKEDIFSKNGKLICDLYAFTPHINSINQKIPK